MPFGDAFLASLVVLYFVFIGAMLLLARAYIRVLQREQPAAWQGLGAKELDTRNPLRLARSHRAIFFPGVPAAAFSRRLKFLRQAGRAATVAFYVFGVALGVIAMGTFILALIPK